MESECFPEILTELGRGVQAGGGGGLQWERGVGEDLAPRGEGLAGEGHPKKDCVGVAPTSPTHTRKHTPCCLRQTLSSE